MSGLVDVLVRPAAFFEREGEDPSIKGPVLVVGLLAILGVLAQGVILSELADAFVGEMRTLFVGLQVFGAVVSLVWPFVVWLLYAAAFFVVSMFFDGEGTFRDVALLTAWGFLPRVGSAVADLVATAVAVTSVDVDGAEVSEPMELAELVAGATAHPATAIASLLGLALLFWSAYIWVAALQESRRLDRREAVLTVAVPVGAALLLRLVLPALLF